MATLPFVMALYGGLDPAEAVSEDPAVAENAARFLPTTEGASGWFKNIEDLVVGPQQTRLPRVIDAMEKIVQPENANEFTIPERARLVYAVGALIHHPDYAPMVADPDSLFAQVLALAGPERVKSTATGYALLQHLYTNFQSFSDWAHVVRVAATNGLIDPRIVDVPSCRASTQNVQGYDCLVINTLFSRANIKLKNIKDVIDPLNWNYNSPNLFCEMTEQDPEIIDYWNRVLEVVSLGCNLGFEQLRTPLRYFKSESADKRVAYVQYKLDIGPFGGPNNDPGDGRVKVDQGFIKMETLGDDPDDLGVRVRTRKIVHIEPLIPAAQAPFVCASGYGTLAAEMMFGKAEDDPPHAPVKWQASTKPAGGPTDQTATGAQPAGAAPPSRPGVASITVDMWQQCLQVMSAKNMEVTSKWLKNKLTANDLIAYSQFVGGEFASAPWKYFKALSEVPLPGTSPDNSNPPGGAT